MRILAIDTASDQVSVAVGNHEHVESSFQLESSRRHVETLVPAIELILSNLRVSLHDLSAIAVDLGPGLFTGMRVGIATAQSLAALCDLPIVGINSLELLANGVVSLALQELNETEIVVPVLDARRHQVYWSMFRRSDIDNDPLVALRPPRVGDIEELVEDLLDRGQHTTLVGTGAVKYREQLGVIREVALVGERTDIAHFAHNPHVPHASTLLSLASQRLVTGKALGEAIAPIYLRAPDAEINWVTR